MMTAQDSHEDRSVLVSGNERNGRPGGSER